LGRDRVPLFANLLFSAERRVVMITSCTHSHRHQSCCGASAADGTRLCRCTYGGVGGQRGWSDGGTRCWQQGDLAREACCLPSFPSWSASRGLTARVLDSCASWGRALCLLRVAIKHCPPCASGVAQTSASHQCLGNTPFLGRCALGGCPSSSAWRSYCCCGREGCQRNRTATTTISSGGGGCVRLVASPQTSCVRQIMKSGNNMRTVKA
jgi:hypothetical protein